MAEPITTTGFGRHDAPDFAVTIERSMHFELSGEQAANKWQQLAEYLEYRAKGLN